MLKFRERSCKSTSDILSWTVEAEHLTESARDQHAQARAIDPDASDSGQDEALAINERIP